MRQTAPGSNYVPTLDGWRAIAILLVIFCHATHGDRPELHMGNGLPEKLWSWLTLNSGPLGVSVFFAISGYLICTRLLIEESGTGSISARSFYLRRVFRILPPAITYLAFMELLKCMGMVALTRADLASCLFFFKNYEMQGSMATGHFWSLAVEEHFYLVWPVLLMLLGSARAFWCAAGLTAATIIWRPFGSTLPWGSSLAHRTDLRADALLIPCALAILIQRREVFRRFLARVAGPALLLILSGILAIVMFAAKGEIHQVVEAFCLPLILCSTTFASASWPARLLETKVIRWIGRLSYSLYLWQQIFLIPQSPAWQIPLRIAAAFLCASLSYYFIEKPATSYGHRLAVGSNWRGQFLVRRASSAS